MRHPINAARAAQGKPLANIVLLRGPGERLKVRRQSGDKEGGKWEEMWKGKSRPLE